MNKTLHKKLTGKHPYGHMPVAYANGDEMLTGLSYEMGVLRNAAKDLLQPRPEAVANLLRMAREI